MTLPQVLDTGDGVTIDRDLALEATRHMLIALKLLMEIPNFQVQDGPIYLEVAYRHVSEILGGAHWWEFGNELVDTVLEQEASHG